MPLEKNKSYNLRPLSRAAVMGTAEFWARFVLAALATWRVAHLLASEDGPDNLITRLRARLTDSFFGKLMDCFGCLSLWISVPSAFFVSRRMLDCVVIWLALSGAAFLLERATTDPLIIEHSRDEAKGN